MMKGRWTWLGAALLAAGVAACGEDEGPLFPETPGTGGSGGQGAAGGGGAGTTTTTTTTSSGDGGGGAGQGGAGGGATGAVVDLRADTNRDGVVDLSDPADDSGEDTWDASHGAVFLANIDDDEGTCPTQNQTNDQLAACNDAADEAVNGPDDLLDLARLRVAPWPGAPADASATVTVSQPGAAYVRLFKAGGGGFDVLGNGGALSAAELAAGVELAIEATDFVRDDAVWDGFVDITLAVDGGTGADGQPIPGGTDGVRMRVAPVLLRHHLDPAQRVHVTSINSTSSQAFRQDLAEAVQAAAVPQPTLELLVSDQWTQDFFETAYMAMPGQGGQKQVIHVNFRSANYGNSGTLRSAGRVVFTVMRGKDVAGAVQYDPNHPNSMDTLNSFGNTETIPPFSHGGQSYPLGRILRGKTPAFYPDESFDLMLASQGHQPPVYLDTSWLLVGHVDETTSFVRAPSARGWALVLADPGLGMQLLSQAQAAGHGDVPMFVGKQWSNGSWAQVTINQVLADPDVQNTNAWAVAEVDGQLQTLMQETGLAEPDVIRIGTVFESQSGYAVAYVPGTVNGIYLSDDDFGAPDPHGPVINGLDIFKQHMLDAFTPYGITIHWIEDWNLYHRLDGEVHCGTNTTRAIPAVSWWESGL